MHFLFFFFPIPQLFSCESPSILLFLYLLEHGQEREVGGSSRETRLENGCKVKEVRDEAQKGH